MTKHVGYAHGSKKLDKGTVEKAIKKLLDAKETTEEPQADGSKVVRVKHETDPPEGLFHPRVAKPGALPVLIAFSDINPEAIKRRQVQRHEHSVLVAQGDDLDTWAYHLARLVVIEARRIRAKSVAVEAVVEGKNGEVVLKVSLVP